MLSLYIHVCTQSLYDQPGSKSHSWEERGGMSTKLEKMEQLGPNFNVLENYMLGVYLVYSVISV